MKDGHNAYKELLRNRGVDFKNRNNVVVIFIGGLDFFFLEGNFFGIKGFAQVYDSWDCGGLVVVGQDPHQRVVAHELGHTFGLMHDLETPKAFMASSGRVAHNKATEMTDFEARWLDKHHYFNAIHRIDAIPKFSYSISQKRLFWKKRLTLNSM